MDTQTLWAAFSGLLGAGAAGGGLLMKVKNIATRVEDVKIQHDADISGIRHALNDLASLHAQHRTETTDRLARIETKLDSLLNRGGNNEPSNG